MFPRMMHQWARRWGAQYGAVGCGPGVQDSEPDPEYTIHGEPMLGAMLGVRRPLRFMAYKLELDDDQVKALAQVLNDLKTERAQAAVDHQRTTAAFADAVESGEFGQARAEEGLALRLASAQRLKDAVEKALKQTHALLRPDQRAKLAYLLRSGTLTI
jgi:Spy/CpxP family protein refolding chaperone